MRNRRVDSFDDSYVLITDSQDIDYILHSIGLPHTSRDYGFLFVKAGNAELDEVWGCIYSIPYNHRVLDQLYPKEERQ